MPTKKSSTATSFEANTEPTPPSVAEEASPSVAETPPLISWFDATTGLPYQFAPDEIIAGVYQIKPFPLSAQPHELINWSLLIPANTEGEIPTNLAFSHAAGYSVHVRPAFPLQHHKGLAFGCPTIIHRADYGSRLILTLRARASVPVRLTLDDVVASLWLTRHEVHQ